MDFRFPLYHFHHFSTFLFTSPVPNFIFQWTSGFPCIISTISPHLSLPHLYPISFLMDFRLLLYHFHHFSTVLFSSPVANFIFNGLQVSPVSFPPFLHILLYLNCILPEGQTVENCKPAKNHCSFGGLGASPNG
jgi:hypothetical protein